MAELALTPGFVVISRYRKAPDIVRLSQKFLKTTQVTEGMQLVYADHDRLPIGIRSKSSISDSDDVSLSEMINPLHAAAVRSASETRISWHREYGKRWRIPVEKGRNELVLAVSD
jgi:hypothetical protein